MGEITRFDASVSKQPGTADTHIEQVPQRSEDLRDTGEHERRV